MRTWSLVTGGSRGVGIEVCRRLSAKGHGVVCLSRRPPAPGTVSGVIHVPCDLSDAGSIDEAVANSASIVGGDGIHAIVFNAAEARFGSTLDMADEHIQRMVAVNFAGPVRLFRGISEFIGPDSRIVYVSTSASRIPAPRLAYYAATKLAFESFVLSAAMEYGYRVHIVRPAEIDTAFAANSCVPAGCDEGKKKLSPAEVAETVVKSMTGGKIFINAGIRAKIIDAVVRAYPSLLMKR